MLHRDSNIAWPSGFVVLVKPLALDVTLKGAYSAERYPCPAAAGELSARKVGNTWLGRRATSFSIATTLPIFGAILPSAAAGLRPICDHVCARECTSAWERIDRTIAIFGSCCASFGSSPVGNRIPFMVSGAKLAGGVPFTTFRSNVSV